MEAINMTDAWIDATYDALFSDCWTPHTDRACQVHIEAGDAAAKASTKLDGSPYSRGVISRISHQKSRRGPHARWSCELWRNPVDPHSQSPEWIDPKNPPLFQVGRISSCG